MLRRGFAVRDGAAGDRIEPILSRL
jgi:hypothetical protein